MFEKVVTFVKTNKDMLIKNGVIALGATVGIVIATVVLRQGAEDLGNPLDEVQNAVEQ